MWGQKWGQMIWGAPPSVPGIGTWLLLCLAAGLILLGVRRLGARPRTTGLVALLLAFAVPLSARALVLPFTFTNGTVADATQVNANFAALANGRIYGFVNAGGTLDASLNGGIIDVNQPFTGQYCFKLGAPAKNAVASTDPTTVFSGIVNTFVPHGGSIGLSGCPTGFNDAAALVRTSTSGALVSGGFYIAFQ